MTTTTYQPRDRQVPIWFVREEWMDNDLAALIAERCALDDVRHFLEQLASATEAAPFRCLVVEGNYDVASSVVGLPPPPSARERAA